VSEQPPFVVKRILGVGMSHPVVARVLFQFSRVLDRNYTTLTEQKSSELKRLLFSLVESMLDAERFKRHYEEKQAEWLKAVTEGTAAELQPHAISFTDPSIELSDYYENFLVKTVITFRRTVTFANASTGRSFKNGKALLDYLRGAFRGEQNIEKWLDVADTWVKATYDERGNAEHGVTNFRPASVITEDGDLRPIAPTVGDPPELASDYIERTWDNLLEYVETCVVLLLEEHLRPELRFIKLPPNHPDSLLGCKYGVWLKNVVGPGENPDVT
jgi:hypothetical protein